MYKLTPKLTVCDPDYKQTPLTQEGEMYSQDFCEETVQTDTIGNCDIFPEPKTKSTTIKTRVTKEDRCISMAALHAKVRVYCDNIFYSGIGSETFLQFVNDGLKTFYNLKPNGWNFTLSDPFKIDLSDKECAYPLPDDFSALSYVAGGREPSNCMSANQYFTIVPYHQWDSIQGGYYATVRDNGLGDVMLHVRTPQMPRGCYETCDNLRQDLTGSIYVKYYQRPETVHSYEDKICSLPKRWGADDVLVQIIAKHIHAFKGKAYQETANFIADVQKLKRLDDGEPLRNPVRQEKNPSIRIAYR